MDKLVLTLARAMAALGGLVLTGLVLLTCVSVVGRMLNGGLHSEFAQTLFPDMARRLLDFGIGPVLGDFELVEAGVAFAIFAFLPYCQITRGHASVDIFVSSMPAAVNRIIGVMVDLIFAAVLVLIAHRLYAGMLDKLAYSETTFMLQFPLWWAYAASLAAASVAAFVACFMAANSLLGRRFNSGEAEP